MLYDKIFAKIIKKSRDFVRLNQKDPTFTKPNLKIK